MKLIAIIAVNLILLFFFYKISRRKGILSFFEGGKWWLTWLSIAVLTLMDELTSIFYVPALSYEIVGVSAFVFIIATSIFMRFLSNRMIEIAHILDIHGIKGGGVYSFSYLVLGPTTSFVAVASILLTYILTAAISTVSAVYNGSSFFHLPDWTLYGLMFLIVWGVAGLNILGVKENARFTFSIFIVAAMLLATLVVSAITDPSAGQGAKMVEGVTKTWTEMSMGGLFDGLGFLVFGLASVILAYSGIEAVIQTAGLVKSWKDIKKAYLFLALTVGIVTPLITMLVLTRTDLDFKNHVDDLITHFATILNGREFGWMIAALASFTLVMAVNTSFVASSELLERVAHRYGFTWLGATNKRDSLYRIHILNATLFSLIISITAGQLEALGHIYAVGLVASFTINMGSLMYYRYSKGSKEITEYYTSRTGTLVIFVLLLSIFIYYAAHNPAGLRLWLGMVAVFLVIGIRYANRRPVEVEHWHQTENPLDILIQRGEAIDDEFHIHFRRPKDHSELLDDVHHAYVTLFSPRAGSPEKLGRYHYRFALRGLSLFDGIESIIDQVKYEFPESNITFHLGWPTSSWVDRMSVGVMVFSLLRLPKRFPQYNFQIEYAQNELKPKEK